MGWRSVVLRASRGADEWDPRSSATLKELKQEAVKRRTTCPPFGLTGLDVQVSRPPDLICSLAVYTSLRDAALIFCV